MTSDNKRTQPSEIITQILVNVLMRRCCADKPENGEEKTGISPERMDQQQDHQNGENHEH